MSDHEQRVRERAYHIWLEEGQPEGRAEAHWDMASELVAIEENFRATLLPNPAAEVEEFPYPEPVEESSLQENLGEFPTLTDQGEEETFPERSHVEEANEAPLSPPQPISRRAARPRQSKA